MRTAAVTKVLCATWQRCRVHFMRNVLAHAGKSGRRVVSAFIATAFAQETPEAASVQWRGEGKPIVRAHGEPQSPLLEQPHESRDDRGLLRRFKGFAGQDIA